MPLQLLQLLDLFRLDFSVNLQRPLSLRRRMILPLNTLHSISVTLACRIVLVTLARHIPRVTLAHHIPRVTLAHYIPRVTLAHHISQVTLAHLTPSATLAFQPPHVTLAHSWTLHFLYLWMTLFPFSVQKFIHQHLLVGFLPRFPLLALQHSTSFANRESLAFPFTWLPIQAPPLLFVPQDNLLPPLPCMTCCT
ncbi:hypothetical protein JB92DRAFT_1031629 [Gautieria morchelliformis]|nr:hypothetical protein JB92DRAFT_1031629 [Gautieria morchelliformis]